jgi:formylglycine-generating enzyme required for sulfatase activity
MARRMNERCVRVQASRQHLWLAAILFTLAAALPAWAQKRVALVIGNGAYTHESRLPNPTNDARLMARTLRGLGFEVEEKLNLPKREMSLALARFVRESSGADTAVLYYAGHGMQPVNGGRNYLLPVDANIDSDDALGADAIPADQVVEQLERQSNPAKLRVVVLDACRNNRQGSRARNAARGLSVMRPADDYTLIAFATNDQDVALDGNGANSPYAEALSRHLARARELPLRRVFELTATDVRQATNQKQRPRTYGDLDSRVGLDAVVLASAMPSAATLPSAAENAAVAEDQAWAAAQRAHSVAGYRAYLAEYPVGRFAAAARVAMVALEAAAAPAAAAPLATPSPTQPVVRPTAEAPCAVCPPMVVIPGGSFVMGSPENEPGRDADEGPQRRVNVARFELGKTEVTQGQWRAVMGSNPSRFSGCGDDCPVEQVSWEDAQAYVRKLNELSGRRYRLPSEAEWEYAARAGSSARYSFGDDEGRLGEHGWFDSNSGRKTQPVGRKQANVFGLHDMHGNVLEWVEDVWHDNYRGAPTDGTAWMQGGDQARRVLRGGSWDSSPQILRSANRFRIAPDYRYDYTGFRIARTL